MFRFVARFARVRIEDSSLNRFALNGIQRDFFRRDFFRGNFIRLPFGRPALSFELPTGVCPRWSEARERARAYLRKNIKKIFFLIEYFLLLRKSLITIEIIIEKSEKLNFFLRTSEMRNDVSRHNGGPY